MEWRKSNSRSFSKENAWVQWAAYGGRNVVRTKYWVLLVSHFQRAKAVLCLLLPSHSQVIQSFTWMNFYGMNQEHPYLCVILVIYSLSWICNFFLIVTLVILYYHHFMHWVKWRRWRGFIDRSLQHVISERTNHSH